MPLSFFKDVKAMKISAIFLAFMFLVNEASAREDGASVRALGMGDAVQASGIGTSGLFFNPAGMALMMQYVIETGYSYTNSITGHVFNVSVVDSSTNPSMAAGFAYSYVNSEIPGGSSPIERNGHLFRGALATGFRDKTFSLYVGGGLKYLSLDRGEAKGVSAATFDAGAVVGVNDQFFIGVAGQNLVDINKEEAPRLLSAGASFRYETLTGSFGAIIDFDSDVETAAQYMFGLEFIAMDTIAVRAGFQMDRVGQDENRVTAGIGYISRYVGFDVGYMQDIKTAENYLIASAIKFFLP